MINIFHGILPVFRHVYSLFLSSDFDAVWLITALELEGDLLLVSTPMPRFAPSPFLTPIDPLLFYPNKKLKEMYAVPFL